MASDGKAASEGAPATLATLAERAAAHTCEHCYGLVKEIKKLEASYAELVESYEVERPVRGQVGSACDRVRAVARRAHHPPAHHALLQVGEGLHELYGAFLKVSKKSYELEATAKVVDNSAAQKWLSELRDKHYPVFRTISRSWNAGNRMFDLKRRKVVAAEQAADAPAVAEGEGAAAQLLPETQADC